MTLLSAVVVGLNTILKVKTTEGFTRKRTKNYSLPQRCIILFEKKISTCKGE
jgi:hypothetical protein